MKMKLTSLITVILFTNAIFVINSYALDDQILVLPPATEGDDCRIESLTERWAQLYQIYSQAVLNSAPIDMQKLLDSWYGDTLTFDIFALDAAVKWGQSLNADRVILSEWNCGENKATIRVRSIDPWEVKVLDTVESELLISAIRSLEQERWLYGVTPGEDLQGYLPPTLRDGKRAVHHYLHDHHLYPPEALIQMVNCSATVKVIVSKNGIPIKVYPPEVTSTQWGFESVIEQALWALSYQPATLNSEHVNGVFNTTLQVYFKK